MTENMLWLLNICKYGFNIYVFFYIYQYLYMGCDIKTKIKKNGKTKIIHKPKIILAFIYLFLLFISFMCLTYKVLLLLMCSFSISGIFLYDRYISEISHLFEKYEKILSIKILWKVFKTIYSIINITFNPINLFVNNIIGKQISYLKKIFFKISNYNSNSSDKHKDNKDNKINYKNIEDVLLGKQTSKFSEYLLGTNKNTNHTKKKTTEFESEFESDFDSSETSKSSETTNTKSDFISSSKLNSSTTTIQKKEITTDISEKKELKNIIKDMTHENTEINKLIEKTQNINNIFNGDKTSDINDIKITEI